MLKRSRLTRKTPLKRTKYGNKITFYSGRLFDSGKEARYAQELDLRRHLANPMERVVSWQGQVKIPLRVNDKLICNYYADFKVRFADGRDEYHEVKGLATDVWRIKEKLFRALYPNITLKVIR